MCYNFYKYIYLRGVFVKDSKIFRNRIIALFDLLGAVLIYLFSIIFNLGLRQGTVNVVHYGGIAIATMLLLYGSFYVAGVYRILWPFAGTKDYVRITASAVVGSALAMLATIMFRYIFPDQFTSNIRNSLRIAFMTTAMASVYSIFIRMFIRVLCKLPAHTEPSGDTDEENLKKVLIVGAGAAATMLIKDLPVNANLNFKIVGLVDDNPAKRGNTLCGYPILGDRNDIPKLCKAHNIDQIFLALPSASATDKNEIIEICSKTKVKLKTVPAIDQMISSAGKKSMIRNVQIEDLLDRNPIVLDNKEISGYIEGKVVMVTGGGGSIGSELCRQIMKYNPKNLVVVDIYENNAYDLQMELNRHYPDNPPTVLIASIRDKERLEDIFKEYKPYIVFHAAAHKHVPLMEHSPCEAIKNNVFGTLNVTMCADKYKVKRFVMISTDKAVNPTNIMGATKRMCEMIVQSMQKISETEFVAVRFGNVLGSNGSVIPLFKKQIEEGGPVTVTHKDITRFFMTIPEAAQLVLQAASYAKGGEIFVLDMGKPVRIYDLAKNIIRLSGYTPGVDIKIEVTGLRPGEKLYEELLMNEEGLKKTRHEKIFIGSPSDITMEELKPSLDLLHEAAESNDADKIKDIVEKVVPTYIKNPEVVNKPREQEAALKA